jgi:hypothetical protein
MAMSRNGVNRPHRWLLSADAAIRAAQARYRDMDGIEIDAQPKIAPDTDGAWVQAWVWVPKDDVAKFAAPGWLEQQLVRGKPPSGRGRPMIKQGE